MEVRPSRFARAYVVVFGLVFVGLLVSVIVRFPLGPGTLITAGMILFAGFFFRQSFRLGAVADGDELVIRNNVRTVRARRQDISGFRLGRPAGMPIGRSVSVLIGESEMVTLDVTVGFYGGGKRSVEDTLARLEPWRKG